MLNALRLNIFRDRLHALRARLDGNAAELRDESSHGVDGDTAHGFSNAPVDAVDRANQQVEIDISIGLAENEAALRVEVDAALQRIKEGTYGICEVCGKAISAKRLHAVPYVSRCIRCERNMENAGSLAASGQ